MIAHGVTEIISADSCGVLDKFPEGTFLVPYRALRDEGTSYHYAPPSRFIDIDTSARNASKQTNLEHGMEYSEILTWSTDGFYRETKEKVTYRKNEGGFNRRNGVFRISCLCQAPQCYLGYDIIYGRQSC